jgi:AraC-like DNA-binding protein
MTADDETLTPKTQLGPSRCSVSARALMPLVAALERAGVELNAFFARYAVAGLRAGLTADSELRFPSAPLEGLWAHAAVAAGDPLFGVHAASSVEEHSFGVFSYLAATSGTWGHALERVCRYFLLLTDAGRYEVSSAGGAAVLAFRADPSFKPANELCDFVVAVPFQYGVRNVPDFHVLEIWLPYPRPPHAGELERFFGAPVRFAAPGVGLVFAEALLAAPLRAAAPELARLLESIADEKVTALPRTGDELAQVRQVLREALREGDASLEAVARRLRLSPRVLQRHLKAQGTGFAAELDAVRRDLALVLVLQPLALQEIAFLLGFSEPAAFHRAFRRWTGEAPGQHRARLRRTA